MIDGKFIRHFRRQRSLSLAQLSLDSGLSVSYISEIERGVKQPSLDSIDKLARALNISKEGLMPEPAKDISDISNPGEKISFLRRQKGLTLTGLADLCGISGTYLCQIEGGKVLPALSTLKAIAGAVGAKPEDLMFTRNHVGYKVKRARQERRLTQAALAERAGVSTGLIGQIESGKVEPSIKTLEKIADAFSLSPCYFVSEDDDPSSLLRPMNPEVRELLKDPKVRSALELLSDCSAEEFAFILKFIELYKEQGRFRLS